VSRPGVAYREGHLAAARAVECPHCGAAPGASCTSSTRREKPMRGVHPMRRKAAAGEHVESNGERIRRAVNRVVADVLRGRS
jgi:hypothetical protein